MPSLEQLYQRIILDHARTRRGLGTVEGVDASNHQVSPTCGGEVTLSAQLAPDGIVERVVWDGDGCSVSQTSLSMLVELVDERPSIDEIAKAYGAMEQIMHSRNHGMPEKVLDLLGNATALESASQFANRVKCALLGWYALRDALAKLGTGVAGDEA